MHTEESLRIVLNSSPLIILAKLGVLEKANNIFNEIEAPRGVLEEIEKKKDKVYVELTRLISEGKISIEDIRKRFPRLGLGESSVIFLTFMKNKVIVLDD